MPSPPLEIGAALLALEPLARPRGLLSTVVVVVGLAGGDATAGVTGAPVGAVGTPEATANGEAGGVGRKGFSCQM